MGRWWGLSVFEDSTAVYLAEVNLSIPILASDSQTHSPGFRRLDYVASIF